jgi:methyl-accepting chemotaxis protein
MKGRYRRKIFFIQKDLQGRLMFKFFLVAVVGTALFYVVFTLFSSHTLSMVYENYHLKLDQTSNLLFSRYLMAQWVFLVFGGLAVAYLTLRFTHKIAGPLYRFEKILDEMAEGRFTTEIVLRKKDEGTQLAQKINRFNGLLSEKVESLRTMTQELETVLNLMAEPATKTGPDVSRQIAQAAALNHRMHEILCGIQLKSDLDGPQSK